MLIADAGHILCYWITLKALLESNTVQLRLLFHQKGALEQSPSARRCIAGQLGRWLTPWTMLR